MVTPTRYQETSYNRTVVVQNKSSLLLKIIFTNTQTLKLFTINNKTENFTTVIKNGKQQGWG
jgi:hypothetical protein